MRKPPSQLPAIVPEVPPHPDAVLTPTECAAWLKLERRQLQRAGVPHIPISHKVRRYRVRDVLAWLETQAAAA
jgi:hypothetical protein